MSMHRERQYFSHCDRPMVARWHTMVVAVDAGLPQQLRATDANSSLQREDRITSPTTCDQPAREFTPRLGEDFAIKAITLRSSVSSSIDIFSSSVVASGVASCGANQAHGGCRRRVRTSEQLFQKTFPSDYPNSAEPFVRSGLTSLRSTSRNARASRSAARSFSLTGIASRMLAPFTRSMERSSKIEIPTAGCAALGRGPRNPRSLITGSCAGLAISVSDGVVNGSLPSGESEPSVTLARAPSGFSSGDGLGIQQPGSNTRGFAFMRQPASGRARDRAMCPAVARNDRRAA